MILVRVARIIWNAAKRGGRSSVTVDLVHSLLIDEHDWNARTSRTYLSAPHPRYALFLTQRLGGAIDTLYIMPVANSARSHWESIAREMRLFHGKTGPRSAHAGGGQGPRCAVPLGAMQRRPRVRILVHVCAMRVCAMRLRREGLNRSLSPWHFTGCGVAGTLLYPVQARTLASGIFFFLPGCTLDQRRCYFTRA